MKNFFRLPIIIGALPVTLTNGTTADATQVMSDLNWIVNQTNSNAAPLATTALTNANNNFTVVQSGIAASQPANFPIASQVQNSSFNTLSSTLGTNTITARVTALPLVAYAVNQIFTFFPSQTNTASATISVDGLPAISILANASPLLGGELQKSSPVSIEYDGTNFNMVNAGPTFSQVKNSALTNLTSTLGTNTISARSLSLPLSAYAFGQVFTFIPSQNSAGGPVTLNVDALGAKSVYQLGSGNVSTGSLRQAVPAQVSYDGSQFNLLGQAQPGWTLIATRTASGGATLDFTNLTGFDSYVFILEALVPGTGGSDLHIRVSDDNGTTFKTASYSYANWTVDGAGGSGAASSSGTAQLVIAGTVSGNASYGVNGSVTWVGLNVAGRTHTYVHMQGYLGNAGNVTAWNGAGYYDGNTNALNGIRFLWGAAATFTSGSIRCYGIRNA